MKTKLFTLFLALVAGVGTIFAESGTCGENLTWDLTDGTLTISGTGTMNDYGWYSTPWYSNRANISSVAISNSVTSIGEYAFSGCSGLTSIEIPNSVTSIGYEAFYGCTGLTSPVYNEHVFAYMPTSYSGAYTIPEGIESIAGGAFSDCTGLTSITIGDSVTSIGNAFYGCENLTSVVWNAKNCANFSSNNTPFRDFWDEYDIRGQITSFVFGDKVEHIPAYLCNGMSQLTSITIPNSVTSIGEYAFSGCSGLTSVTIPNSVTSIGEYAFSGCSGLTSVTIGNSVTSIGDKAFSGCKGLTSITIPNSVTSISEGAFSDCNKLTDIYAICGDLNRVKQLLNNDTRVKYTPLPYSIMAIAVNGNIQTPQNTCDALELTTIPDNGYHFVQWSDGNKDNPRVIELTKDTTFEAIFAHNPVITFFYDASVGTISGASSTPTGVAEGNVTITAVPNEYRHFVRWADGNKDNPRTIYLTKDTTMEAIFAPNPRITYKYDSSRGYVYGSQTTPTGVAEGEITFTANPNRGINFVKWADGNKDNPRTIYLDRDTTMEAIFEYRLTDKCGKDSALVWTLDSTTLALTITGSGELTENYTYGQYIKSLTIEDEVTNIGSSAFYNCYGLTSVTIGDGVTDIGEYSFYNCSVENLVLGASVKVINRYAFAYNYVRNESGYQDYNNPSIKTITCNTMRPPTVQWNTYDRSFPENQPYSTIIYVLASNATYYQVHDFWGLFDVQSVGYLLTLSANNADYGSVEGAGAYTENSEAVFSANPYTNYHFVRWNDGITENPRTIVITRDTTFTAEFAINKSGVCGKDNALRWTYEDKTQTLTISGKGELTENYTFGIEAPTQMKVLVIGNDVTAIGENAFYGRNTIKHLTIGGNVATIGDNAFAECNRFDDITCFAEEEPVINATTFANVGNKQYIYLFVPASRERAYKRDIYWGEFDVQVNSAEATTTGDDVKVTPTDNTATITWPSVDGANTYEIAITKDGEVVCTLIFNSNGQLTGIAFMPGRNRQQHTQTTGFRFTVTGLASNTNYDYTIDAKDDNDVVLDSKSGSFETTGSNVPTDIESADESTVTPIKFIRDNQVLILRGEKTYTVTGQEIK